MRMCVAAMTKSSTCTWCRVVLVTSGM
jgi:hypothetical protein